MVINMWIYSWQEIVSMTAAAIALDWLIGDPKWPTHPVILIGRSIRWVEDKLHKGKETSVLYRLDGCELRACAYSFYCVLSFSVMLGAHSCCSLDT